VAKDEVTFSDHHFVILGDVDDMPTHAVRRTYSRQRPLRSGVAHHKPTITQTTCALSNKTYLTSDVRA
jgi:hypothetical protein